jgi:non-ribosomal peptide synthetase component F
VFDDVRVAGPLDRGALERAWAGVVARHAALETTFRSEGASVVQDVQRRSPATFEQVDLGVLQPAQREARYREQLEQLRRRVFDLATWPAFCCVLFRFDDNDHALVLVFPHILVDRWSIEIIYRDLAALYASAASEPASALAALPIDYVDYALYERRILDASTRARRVDYWKDTLAGAPDALQLWTAAAQADTSGSGRVELELDGGLVRDLRRLASARSATLFHVVLSGFVTLLHRYSGATDLVVGTSIDHRGDDATWPIVGCFMDHLPIRAAPLETLTFGQLVTQVRDRAVGAMANAIPFDVMLEELRPARHVGRDPIFQVTFNVLIGRGAPTTTLGSCRLHDRLSGLEIDRLYLNVTLRDDGDRATGALEYSRAHFDHSAAQALAAHYVRLLVSGAETPNGQLAELTMMDDEDAAMQ